MTAYGPILKFKSEPLCVRFKADRSKLGGALIIKNTTCKCREIYIGIQIMLVLRYGASDGN